MHSLLLAFPTIKIINAAMVGNQWILITGPLQELHVHGEI